jgi:hypothetical protein
MPDSIGDVAGCYVILDDGGGMRCAVALCVLAASITTIICCSCRPTQRQWDRLRAKAMADHEEMKVQVYRWHQAAMLAGGESWPCYAASWARLVHGWE